MGARVFILTGMDAEEAREFLLGIPGVVETMQWGANLVFWVGDKKIGGKMFALVPLEGEGRAVISYCAGAERYAELLEREGFFPAPYLARAHWVAVERWSAFRSTEWRNELTAAHALVMAKLPRKVREVFLAATSEKKRTRGRTKRPSTE